MKKIISAGEIFAIILFALVPVFLSFPYRINIFLSWEGAYRITEGHIPFKDFGMPVGYMYWMIPAMFFKLFGAQLITLIKAQAFINILSGLAFRSIFVSLKVPPQARFIGVLVFILSYSFPNYWPWYNHTVIVFQFISLAFLLKFLTGSQNKKAYILLFLSAFFIICSFFTKQDGGGLGFLICIALLIYEGFSRKKWIPLAAFLVMAGISTLIILLPVSGQGFSYWFNYGQPPHSSRISISDILGEFLKGSFWIKFYLMMAIIFLIILMKNIKDFFADRYLVLLFLITLGILAEAAIFQVTSYVPEDNNFFFHSFGVVFLLSMLIRLLPIDIANIRNLVITAAAVLLWWSSTYWNYLDRFILKSGQKEFAMAEYNGYQYATEVNKNTYMIELDTTEIQMDNWSSPNLKSFEKILLPNPTVEGINRLMELPLLKKTDLKVLNMTELTPLAKEIPFELEKGSHYPLWYHQGVAMFDKETNMFVERIENLHYDLVLFEYIPYLNNFYPFKVRQALEDHYEKIDSFTAPRKPTRHAWVEVYVKRNAVEENTVQDDENAAE